MEVTSECHHSDKSLRSSLQSTNEVINLPGANAYDEIDRAAQEAVPHSSQPVLPIPHGGTSILVINREQRSSGHDPAHLNDNHPIESKSKQNPLCEDLVGLGVGVAVEGEVPQPMAPPEFLHDSKSDSAWNVELADISGMAVRGDEDEELDRTAETPHPLPGTGPFRAHPAASSLSTATTDLRPQSLGFVSIEPPDPQFWQGKLALHLGSLSMGDGGCEVKASEEQYCPAETLVVSVTHWLTLCSESTPSSTGTTVAVDLEAATNRSTTEVS